MEVFKETKYLAFVIAPTEKKTLTVAIINRHHQEIIGEIKWFAKWRQYCFFPYKDTVWNTTCMDDVHSVIKELMEQRKPIKKI